MPKLIMSVGNSHYPIQIERGILSRVGELFNLNRRVLILTDQGVPASYAETVANAAKEPCVVTLPSGEANKCPAVYLQIMQTLLDAGFDRNDAVVSVGGGVIGDLGGFVASTYMRGIDFYNVPTTLLAQIDSSVGGKVAIDFGGYKNIIGAFYQPKSVLIDPNVLSTLDARQFACGMAEAIKMFTTSDGEMFTRLEVEGSAVPTDEIILRALQVKMAVVGQDEKESSLRKILNFGHTVGHAIESVSAADAHPLLHGECVALGMLAMTDGETRHRIKRLLCRYDLPTTFRCDIAGLREALVHDKKAAGDAITTVRIPQIGSYTLQKEGVDAILAGAREVIEFL